jgi:hypothetical protein
MAENFTGTEFAAVSTCRRSDANAESFTGKEFEGYLKFTPLNRRSPKRYIDWCQTQMNLENLIFQAFQI